MKTRWAIVSLVLVLLGAAIIAWRLVKPDPMQQLIGDINSKPSVLEQLPVKLPLVKTSNERKRDALKEAAQMGSNAAPAIPAIVKSMGGVSGGSMEAYTLLEIGPSAEPALIAALSSTNSMQRMYAALTLGRVATTTNGADALMKALNDKDDLVRNVAAIALGRSAGDPDKNIAALIRALSDKDDTVQMNAARSLGRYGEEAKPAVPALLALLDRCDYGTIQHGIAYALLRIAPAEATQDAIKKLDSSDANARKGAAMLLRFFKGNGEAAIPTLIRHLKDPEVDVRKSCAVALREIGLQGSIVAPALIEGLDDPEPEFRTVAAIALRSFPTEAKVAVPAIVKILHATEDRFTAEPLLRALDRIDPEAAEKTEKEIAGKKYADDDDL